jgi:hypothetical protein
VQDKDRFYCVCCSNMFDQDEAHIIFRTGFFKNVHPLGCCKKCHADAEIAVSRQTDENWDGSKEASVVHLASGTGYEPSVGPLKKPAAVYSMAVSF